MKEIIVSILVLLGVFFVMVAAIGILRFPDLFSRMHAATKASSFGLGFLLVAAAVHFATAPVIAKMVAAVAFIYLTSPIAGHMIGRAGYLRKVGLWKGTEVDELAGRYDTSDNKLE